MTEKFAAKVKREGTYDTFGFRYMAENRGEDDERRLVIKRIALDKADTAAAQSDRSDANPDGWEIVYMD